MEIDQARLLVLHTAALIDKHGDARGARKEVAMIKVVVPQMACRVIDRALQAHGGAGVCQDFPLAEMYAHMRTLRIADGPDEVHWHVVGRAEIGYWNEHGASSYDPKTTYYENVEAGSGYRFSGP